MLPTIRQYFPHQTSKMMQQLRWERYWHKSLYLCAGNFCSWFAELLFQVFWWHTQQTPLNSAFEAYVNQCCTLEYRCLHTTSKLIKLDFLGLEPRHRYFFGSFLGDSNIQPGLRITSVLSTLIACTSQLISSSCLVMAQDFEFGFFAIFPGDLKDNPFK